MKSLRLILGDQLSHGLSSLKGIDPARDVILMMEVAEEASMPDSPWRVGHSER